MNNNPFKTFDIKEEYNIDVNLISEKYKLLQKKFHPDNFANSTAKERLMATQISANITDSYNLLLDPIKRAEKLLNLLGVNFSMQNYTSKDNSMLFEQMQLREELETIEQTDMNIFAERIDKKFRQKEQQFLQEINSVEDETKITDILLSMRFYQKIQQEIRQKNKETK